MQKQPPTNSRFIYTLLRPFHAFVEFIEELRVRSGSTRKIGRESYKEVLVWLAGTYSLTIFLAMFISRAVPGYEVLVAILAVILPPAAYTAIWYLKALDYSTRVLSELEYFIISLGLSEGVDVELGRDVVELGGSWRRYASTIFPALLKFSDRLTALSAVFGILESLRVMSERFTAKLRRLFSEYLTAYSMGLGGVWITDSLRYYTRSLKERARNAVKTRIMFSIALSALIGYVPPIASLMTNLIGHSAISYAIALMLILIPVGIASVPRLPRHMMQLRSRHSRLQSALFLAGIPLLLAGILLLSKPILLASGAVLMLSGITWLKELLDALKELHSLSNIIKAISEMPLVTVGNINRLRAYLENMGGTLTNFPRGRCEEYHYWITCFVDFTISNIFSRGDVRRETLILLKDVIENMIADIQRLIVTGVGLAVVSVGITFLLVSTTQLLLSVDSLLIRYLIASSVALGIFVSKAGFDKISSGLVPGISLMILIGGGVL